jgi:ornithine cyclodeaminase/alanine dehydrogenase-like protein (mu-crystallin family)
MKPLRHLSPAEVAAAMPPLPERLELASRVMLALGREAEMPAKIGVHPRQAGSLGHAMPALLRGAAGDGSEDLIGLKWIAGFPQNPARGLPTYSALVILNDAITGQPIAIMDGGAITAQRTAAISGVAIRLLAGAASGPAGPGDGARGYPARVAILGAGAQARSHLPVIGYLLPGAEIAVTDRDAGRARELAEASGRIEGIAAATVEPGIREAVEGADLVVSVVSFGPRRQNLDPSWLAPEALFVAVDYDMQAPAALAREALFVVDERDQFLATRSADTFAGYPEPDVTLGDALRGSLPGGVPLSGRVLVAHLGVGLADVVFASAILARAESLGLGRILPR